MGLEELSEDQPVSGKAKEQGLRLHWYRILFCYTFLTKSRFCMHDILDDRDSNCDWTWCVSSCSHLRQFSFLCHVRSDPTLLSF